MERLLLKVEEAAERLSMGRSKAYELVQSGELPVIHVGRSVRIPVAALERWVERKAAEAEGDAGPV